MAEALVSALLQLFSGQILKEFSARWAIKKEIGRLQHSLSAIKPFLEDAEKREAQEEAMNPWLKKVRDVCYEIDDKLDELNYAIETPHIDPIVPKIKKLIENLDVIVEEKGRVSEEVEERISEEVEEQVSEEVEEPRISPFGDESGGRRLRNRDECLNTLITLLLAKEINPFVISLVGMGGIGKKFLARKACNDNRVKASFDMMMYVHVSSHFDRISIAKAIIESLGHYNPNISELQTLITKIIDLIRGKKFLLVLDDMCYIDLGKWEPFRLALKFGAPGSKIIVTTRDIEVAHKMRSEVIHLDSLTEEEAWLLFHESTCPDKNLQRSHGLEPVGQEIVKACKGLPLALITVGKTLQGRQIEVWYDALDQIKSSYPKPKIAEVNRLSMFFLFTYYN